MLPEDSEHLDRLAGSKRGAGGYRGLLRRLVARALDELTAEGMLPPTGGVVSDMAEFVRRAADAKFGDYSATVAMPLAKRAGLKPRDLAAAIGRRLNASPQFLEAFEPVGDPVGPGFINIRVRDDSLARAFVVAQRSERFGIEPVEQPDRIVVDFGSPNVAKPMHVGHIRSTVIGDALARILRFRGHEVITDNHLGDWGTQFGMILWGWKHSRDEAAYATNPTRELGRLYRLVRKVVDAKPEELVTDPQALALATAHPEAGREVLAETAKLHEGDPENRGLWERFMPVCLEEIDRVFARLGVRFDHALGESFYQPLLAGVVESLLADPAVGARESRGAIGVFLRGEESPPFLIRKADGAFLYATTDLATLQWRLEHWHPDRILYVVDSRQSPHFEQLFETARRWGCGAKERIGTVALVHVAFGTVLGEDGRPFKTRTGDAVGLESLLDEGVERALAIVGSGEGGRQGFDEQARGRVAETVGIGAIKYADLCQNRTTDYVFSFDKMLELKGNTAAYMQYAVARVEGIFARAGIDRASLRQGLEAVSWADPRERSLALELLRFGETLEDVEADYRPNLLTAWLYELAGLYSSFYDALPVLKAEEPARSVRLALCDLTGRVLRQGLDLLGIGTVEKM
jgi:arginyl-tRNA synthetase